MIPGHNVVNDNTPIAPVHNNELESLSVSVDDVGGANDDDDDVCDCGGDLEDVGE
jgi:hypothetical protein